MPFARIGDLDVDFTEFGRLEPLPAGQSSRSASLALRSTIRPGGPRRWSGTLRALTPEEADALEAALPNGLIAPCSGSAFRAAVSVPIDCQVTWGARPYVWQDPSDPGGVEFLVGGVLTVEEAAGVATGPTYVPPPVAVAASIVLSASSVTLDPPMAASSIVLSASSVTLDPPVAAASVTLSATAATLDPPA